MKRLVSVLIIILTLTLALAGCFSGNPSGNPGGNPEEPIKDEYKEYQQYSYNINKGEFQETSRLIRMSDQKAHIFYDGFYETALDYMDNDGKITLYDQSEAYSVQSRYYSYKEYLINSDNSSTLSRRLDDEDKSGLEGCYTSSGYDYFRLSEGNYYLNNTGLNFPEFYTTLAGNYSQYGDFVRIQVNGQDIKYYLHFTYVDADGNTISALTTQFFSYQVPTVKCTEFSHAELNDKVFVRNQDNRYKLEIRAYPLGVEAGEFTFSTSTAGATFDGDTLILESPTMYYVYVMYSKGDYYGYAEINIIQITARDLSSRTFYIGSWIYKSDLFSYTSYGSNSIVIELDEYISDTEIYFRQDYYDIYFSGVCTAYITATAYCTYTLLDGTQRLVMAKASTVLTVIPRP